MTLTEQRIGELWDEAVGGVWTLDHKMIVDFVRRVEREVEDAYPVTHDLAEALFAHVTGAGDPGPSVRALQKYEALRRGTNR